MGIAAADIEADGDLDLFVTNFQGEANNLYVSDRHGVFRDVSFLSGVGRPSLAWLGFGAVFADLDNDAAPDLCVTNGHVLDNAPILFPGTDYRQRDVCFRNLGGSFEPVVLDLPPAVGRGLVAIDFDEDGLLDLAVSRSGGTAALLRNGGAPAPRAVLRLVGRASNRDGVGAEVVVERGGQSSRSVVTAGSSYLSSGRPGGVDRTSARCSRTRLGCAGRPEPNSRFGWTGRGRSRSSKNQTREKRCAQGDSSRPWTSTPPASPDG